MGITSDRQIQTNFIDFDSERARKMAALGKVIDRLNRINGRDSIILSSQQYAQKGADGKPVGFADAIQHNFRSKNPTTRWNDIIYLL